MNEPPPVVYSIPKNVSRSLAPEGDTADRVRLAELVPFWLGVVFGSKGLLVFSPEYEVVM